jgi:hypothetical protein
MDIIRLLIDHQCERLVVPLYLNLSHQNGWNQGKKNPKRLEMHGNLLLSDANENACIAKAKNGRLQTCLSFYVNDTNITGKNAFVKLFHVISLPPPSGNSRS